MALEKVLAMAVAAVAEKSGVDTDRMVVRSFREVPKSSLEQFIEDHGIAYHKYQLGE